MTHGRLSSNQYRICPYSIKECGFDTDRRFKSGFYRPVEFDRGRKPSDWKGYSRFSGEPYRVCLYSTTKDGLSPFRIVLT